MPLYKSMTYYGITDTALQLGLDDATIRIWYRKKKIPEPEIIDNKQCYSAETIEHIRGLMSSRGFKHARDGTAYLSISQIARECGVSSGVITRMVRLGQIPAPDFVNCFHPRYSLAQADQIKLVVANRTIDNSTPNRPEKIARAKGFFCVNHAARHFGVQPIRLYYRIKKGLIPQPTHKVGGRLCWTTTEIRAMKKIATTNLHDERAKKKRKNKSKRGKK